MALWQRGQLVEFDGLLAVVVGIDGDPWVPEEHVALRFGEPRACAFGEPRACAFGEPRACAFGEPRGLRTAQGGTGGLRPEVWTVPEEYCKPAAEAVVRH